ncbi:MAG: acyl-CoA dehydratase activase [Planctomycetota bacterium]
MQRRGDEMIVGIDLGSRTVKVLSWSEGRERRELFDTVPFYKRYARRGKGGLALELARLRVPAGATVVATGYGRNLLAFENATVIPEIEAHAEGAMHATGARTFVLVDIGGQDTKVATVRGGRITDFEMNDRCAAGTGRFLETIAGALDMQLAELARCTEGPVELSATCAIYSESEVVGRLAEGCTPESLAAGANLSVAKRVAPMVPRDGPRRIYASGGGARNMGVIELLAERLGRRVEALTEPEYVGALGALMRAGRIARQGEMRNAKRGATFAVKRGGATRSPRRD